MYRKPCQVIRVLFSLSLFGLSSRGRISEDLRFPDFRFRMRRTRLARKGNREAALSASQFRPVLEQPSGLTAMQAKVQVAITRGLFAARDALSCARLSRFRGIYGHDVLTAEGRNEASFGI